MPEFNPYAAPRAEIEEIAGENQSQEGVWADGKTLVIFFICYPPSPRP